MQHLELDSIPAAGIVRMNSEGPTSYMFNCHVPNSIKEDDVAEYLCSILDVMKDQFRERKSWRFKERRQKQARQDKPNHNDRPLTGQTLKGKLDKALNKNNG